MAISTGSGSQFHHIHILVFLETLESVNTAIQQIRKDREDIAVAVPEPVYARVNQWFHCALKVGEIGIP